MSICSRSNSTHDAGGGGSIDHPEARHIPYLFVADSGWVPHIQDDDDGGYCPVPSRQLQYCPVPSRQLQYCPVPSRQLQMLDPADFGGLPPKTSAGAVTPDRRGDATPQAPFENFDVRQSAKASGAPGAKLSEAAPQPVRSAAEGASNAATEAGDVWRAIKNVGAFVAPMILLQGARAGLRQARKLDEERNLAVSFTSAGGVNAVVFRLGYDAERMAVTGVRPGVDLPETARVTLTCVPDGSIADSLYRRYLRRGDAGRRYGRSRLAFGPVSRRGER